MLSLDQRTMYFAEAAREYTKKGVITEAFVRRKKRFQRGIDAKKEAAMLNRTYRKITQKPVTKRKRAGKR